MDNLLIHPTTVKMLRAYSGQLPHALLLIGPEGVGKRTIAEAWARKEVDTPPELVTPDEKGSLGIETIRELYRGTRAKRVAAQIVIVDHAEAMSPDAQNAFLKLLEEPRPGVHFILTANHNLALLPTVLSRVQQLPVQPVPANVLQTFIAKEATGLSATELAQVLFIAQGRPGMAKRLLTNETAREAARETWQQAKELLATDAYNRYLAISSLNDRSTALTTLEAMLHIALLQLKKSHDEASRRRWTTRVEAINQALATIEANGNIKAQLLALFAQF